MPRFLCKNTPINRITKKTKKLNIAIYESFLIKLFVLFNSTTLSFRERPKKTIRIRIYNVENEIQNKGLKQCLKKNIGTTRTATFKHGIYDFLIITLESYFNTRFKIICITTTLAVENKK